MHMKAGIHATLDNDGLNEAWNNKHVVCVASASCPLVVHGGRSICIRQL